MSSHSYADQPPLNQVYTTSDFAQGVERGKFLERERIVLLLEDEKQRLIDITGSREGGPGWRSAGIQNCEHTIALIKGEK